MTDSPIIVKTKFHMRTNSVCKFCTCQMPSMCLPLNDHIEFEQLTYNNAYQNRMCAEFAVSISHSMVNDFLTQPYKEDEAYSSFEDLNVEISNTNTLT